MFICASPLGEAQLNRMLDRCRPLGPASPTGRVNTWPSSTLTPASTADLRPRPTCSATSASVLLRFIRWCSRLSVKVGYERSPASPAASRCSSIPNACLSYANLNPSNPLGRGTSSAPNGDDHVGRKFQKIGSSLVEQLHSAVYRNVVEEQVHVLQIAVTLQSSAEGTEQAVVPERGKIGNAPL